MTLLGTGGPTADPRRGESCTLVSLGETHVLVDAGRGSAVQLRRAGVDAGSVEVVLLTHHHVDHLAELASLIRMSWFGSGEPLRILGPTGTSALVDQLLEGPFAKSFAADRAYDRWRRGGDGPATLAVARDITTGTVLTFDGWTVRAAEVEHGQELLGIGDWWHCLGAGRIAADAQVGQLALTHLGPNARASEMEGDARRSYDGPVVLGTDLLQIDLDRPSGGTDGAVG